MMDLTDSVGEVKRARRKISDDQDRDGSS